MPCKPEEVRLEEGIAGQLARRRDRMRILESLMQHAVGTGCDVLVSFTPYGEVIIEDGVANERPLICSVYGYSRAACVTPQEAAPMESTATSTPAVSEVAEWLRGALANGPVAAADLFTRAKTAGIAEKTLRRASKALGVCKEKAGMHGGWQWSLPKMAKLPEDGHESLNDSRCLK